MAKVYTTMPELVRLSESLARCHPSEEYAVKKAWLDWQGVKAEPLTHYEIVIDNKRALTANPVFKSRDAAGESVKK